MPARTPSSAGSWHRGLDVTLPPLIVLCGATATGKTRLSVALAARLGHAEIVSADSRQVYRGMDVGTAKVSAAERSSVPHHGLDLVDPDEALSAAGFRGHAMTTLLGIAERGNVALLVGGSGLYVRAVARGLPLDDTGHDAAVRARLEERLLSEGLAALAAELTRTAPTMAAGTDLANPRRVVRALERATVLGDLPPPRPTGYPAPVLWLGLTTPPEAHARAIEERVRSQFRDGLLEEAASLRARYPEDLRAFSAMGYREAFDVLAGRTDLASAIAADSTRTRQYARRQRTWFRAETDVHWVAAGEGALAAAWPLVEAFRAGIAATTGVASGHVS